MSAARFFLCHHSSASFWNIASSTFGWTNMDDSTSTANLLALISCILTAITLLVALQGVLTYNLAAAQRDKCTDAAIGHPTAQYTRFRWSFRTWRVKVYYPVLNLGCMEILRASSLSETRRLQRKITADKVRLENSNHWFWRTLDPWETPGKLAVCDGQSLLVKTLPDGTTAPVSYLELPWLMKIRYLLSGSLVDRLRGDIPRATWAEILYIFDIDDSALLLLGYADSDRIPQTAQTPFQRIRLSDLGIMAFVMGFLSVKISVEHRQFEAVGSFATISTERREGVGSVLSVEGDIVAVNKLIHRRSTFWLLVAAWTVQGSLCIGTYRTRGLFIPLDLIRDAVKNSWHANLYDEAEADNATARYERDKREGYAIWEGSLMQSIQPESESGQLLSTTEVATWQLRTGMVIPTILVAASFFNISGICAGFPSRVAIEPILKYCQFISTGLLTHSESSFHESILLQRELGRGTLEFVRETSKYLMSTGQGGGTLGLFSWTSRHQYEVYDTLPPGIMQEMMTAGICGLVMPDVMHLLTDYNPNKWRDWLERKHEYNSVYDFNAENMLWAQIVLLDCAIRLRLEGRDEQHRPIAPESYLHPWLGEYIIEQREASVLDGIIESGKIPSAEREDSTPGQTPLFRAWDLAGSLASTVQLPPSERDDTGQSNTSFEILANLLKLRSLIVLAFLALNPDSSDVFLARNSNVEMLMM